MRITIERLRAFTDGFASVRGDEALRCNRLGGEGLLGEGGWEKGQQVKQEQRRVENLRGCRSRAVRFPTSPQKRGRYGAPVFRCRDRRGRCRRDGRKVVAGTEEELLPGPKESCCRDRREDVAWDRREVLPEQKEKVLPAHRERLIKASSSTVL